MVIKATAIYRRPDKIPYLYRIAIVNTIDDIFLDTANYIV